MKEKGVYIEELSEICEVIMNPTTQKFCF